METWSPPKKQRMLGVSGEGSPSATHQNLRSGPAKALYKYLYCCHWCHHYQYSYFIDQETETKNGELTWPRPCYKCELCCTGEADYCKWENKGCGLCLCCSLYMECPSLHCQPGELLVILQNSAHPLPGCLSECATLPQDGARPLQLLA